ncbi:Endonuclease (plasmid) [Cupriavidus necator H16]
MSNRRTWSHIETSTRRLARQHGAIQVVTGPAFVGTPRTLGHVHIPDFIWKAIHVPGIGAAVYLVRNDATPAYSVISVAELRHFAGIDPFPTLPKAMNATAMDLPLPTPHPGEKAARRVAFAWLASGEAAAASRATEPLHQAIRDASAILSLALAHAR